MRLVRHVCHNRRGTDDRESLHRVEIYEGQYAALGQHGEREHKYQRSEQIDQLGGELSHLLRPQQDVRQHADDCQQESRC